MVREEPRRVVGGVVYYSPLSDIERIIFRTTYTNCIIPKNTCKKITTFFGTPPTKLSIWRKTALKISMDKI
jgi:hypothetical protein